MLSNNNQQKSPQRRFLLFLVITGFVCFLALGLMVIFWKSITPGLSDLQRILFGAFIIIYAALRFPRFLRRRDDSAMQRFPLFSKRNRDEA